MDNRTRALAALNYKPYDRLPLAHFSFWTDTLEKWAAEGHITAQEAREYDYGNGVCVEISRRLGFDLTWNCSFSWNMRLDPPIEKRVVEERPDGSRVVMNEDGASLIEKAGTTSLPGEADHLLKGRKEWEEIFKPRLQWQGMERINAGTATVNGIKLRFDQGGKEMLIQQEGAHPLGLYCGGMIGTLRDWLGLVNMSYLLTDDEPLFDEIADTVGELAYQGTEAALETGVRFDFAHFWEDICYRGGPMLHPKVFARKIGPKYKRISELVRSYGIQLVSVDCDGKIDALIPIWLDNGVNVMFPMEIGVWNANLKPWREQYGKELRGIGGVNKFIFNYEREAIDAEIERLRPLVDLGGFIPCPDHSLTPEARWENVQYYCERMRRVFSN
jgi:uroporphyrinogen decarboxylase